MAKNNPGDILTCDWNPVIGCQRFSAACRKCWYLDGIFPWQQRLGNIPAQVRPNEAWVFEKRMKVEALKPKRGVIGICQHGDLFWDGIQDEVIDRVLGIVEETAAVRRNPAKYVLWTKRARRMAEILTRRWPRGIPDYLAAAVSVEDQASADERLPHLVSVRGGTRIAVAEPLLGQVSLAAFVDRVDWVIVGSETGGEDAVTLDPAWARTLRDQAQAAGKPFFIKQLGKRHDDGLRILDGRTWDERPAGFEK